MTVTEWKLFGVLVVVYCICTFAFRLPARRNAVVFLTACAIGYLVQLPLGVALNRYTPNITVYFGYVSLAVVITWGIGLLSFHAAHLWVARLLNRRASLWLYYLCGLPVIVILEFVGSNFLRMKLYNYGEFHSLMPAINAMHAPAWLYVYYGLVALIFYFVQKVLPAR